MIRPSDTTDCVIDWKEFLTFLKREFDVFTPGIFDVRRLRGGIENIVLEVKAQSGAQIVRLHRNATVETITEEAEVLSSLAGRTNVRVPKLTPSNSGHAAVSFEGRLCSVYPSIDGRPLAFGIVPDATLISNLVEFMNALHSLPTAQRGRRQRFNLDTLRGEIGSANLAAFNDAIDREKIDSELQSLEKFESLLSQESQSFIHADMTYGNVLVDEAGNLVGVIDFDDGVYAAPAFDFALLVRGLCFTLDGRLDESAFDLVYRSAGLDNRCSRADFLSLVRLSSLRMFCTISRRCKDPSAARLALLDYARFVGCT